MQGFGIIPEIPSNITLNYISVAICIVTILMVIFIDIDVQTDEKSIEEEEEQKLIDKINESNNSNYYSILDKTSESCNNISIKIEQDVLISPGYTSVQKKWNWMVGILVSIISGIGFGFSYTPVLYVVDNYKGSSINMSDYTFSMNSGVLISALVYFIIYSSVTKKNQQQVNGRIFLPSFLTGVLWTISNTAFFMATNTMSQSITFPITNCCPSVVTLFIALLFKEINGTKNFIWLFIILCMTIAGSVLCGISK